jgi:coenzyme F420-reducing hydrogenase beta subunit
LLSTPVATMSAATASRLRSALATTQRLALFGTPCQVLVRNL